jgi:hypothetical protein
METTNEILTELLEITPFLVKNGLSRAPYSVPVDYFNHFADLLMNRIRSEGREILDQPKTEISSFDEITEISPLLASLQKKNTFQLSEGFFESLEIKIPSEIISGKDVSIPSVVTPLNPANRKTRVISFPIRIIRYAAAACIIGMIGITTFQIANHQNSDPIKSLTSVSDQDMANFLDEDDIHWTPGLSSPSETASAEFSDNDIHELLSGVPDEELEQYSQTLPAAKATVN